jgi:anti-anti-sigma factor
MDHRRIAAPSLTVDVVAPPGGRHARLRLAGELDGTTDGALTDAVERVLRTAAPEAIQLHAAAVTFVDSVGMRCLLTCRAKAQDSGCRLSVVEPSRQMTRILDITGLPDLFGLPARPDDRPAGRGPHRGCPVDEVFARSAMIRRAARETCAHAEAVRGAGPLRPSRR